MRLAWLILVVLAAPASAESRKLTVDRIAAVVNDSVILLSELDLRMLPVRAQAAQLPDPRERDRRLEKLARQTLDAMIDDELVVQAAIEARITAGREDVDAAIDLLKREHGLDDQQLAEAMAQQGMTRETLRMDVLRQRAINQLVGPKVVVSEEDVRSRYDDMQRRSQAVSAVSVSQIVFALPDHPTEQERADARRKAQRAIDRIRAGEAFAKVAAEVSEDPSTRASGGMLGWIQADALTKDWETVVLGMDKGDVRGPVVLGGNVYVLTANEVKRVQLQPFADSKARIASELRHQALVKHTRAWIADLRKKAYIEIKL